MGRSSARWSQENDIILLANLDFIIEKIREETGRLGSIDEVLQNLKSELPKPGRTRDQIDRRLRKLWKDHNANPGPWNTYESIYRFGSTSLGTLASVIKARVAAELNILHDNQKLKVVGTPRKTRSESRTVYVELSSAKPVRGPSNEHTPTQSRRKHSYQSPPQSASKRIKQDAAIRKVCEPGIS
jgi:hypothetical protein